MDTEKILEKVEKLIDMYKQGKLGGEILCLNQENV